MAQYLTSYEGLEVRFNIFYISDVRYFFNYSVAMFEVTLNC